VRALTNTETMVLPLGHTAVTMHRRGRLLLLLATLAYAACATACAGQPPATRDLAGALDTLTQQSGVHIQERAVFPSGDAALITVNYHAPNHLSGQSFVQRTDGSRTLLMTWHQRGANLCLKFGPQPTNCQAKAPSIQQAVHDLVTLPGIKNSSISWFDPETQGVRDVSFSSTSAVRRGKYVTMVTLTGKGYPYNCEPGESCLVTPLRFRHATFRGVVIIDSRSDLPISVDGTATEPGRQALAIERITFSYPLRTTR
jgi:hypothetical protein